MPEETAPLPLGLDAEPISATVEVSAGEPDITTVRPFLKLSIVASVVPESKLDKGRWYHFSAGIGSSAGDTNCATLTYDNGGKSASVSGASGLISCSASDSLGGQSCSLRFPQAGLMTLLLPRLRPMDRVRVSVVVPGRSEWLVFDGLIRTVRSSRRAGSGWSAEVTINASGIDTVLSGAVFNWQGMVHPDSTIMKSPTGKTLAESLQKSAVPPHKVAQIFIESAVNSAMGIKIGDPDNSSGLSVLDYILFPLADSSQWSSWPDTAYPLPWPLIASQSGSTFWGIAQMIAEPNLHELFVGYREQATEASSTGGAPGPLRPTLVHRPRPFPGREEWDSYWKALKVVKVGGRHGTNVMGVDDSLSMDRHANCFHWAGLGLGDHSTEAFFSKLFFGWSASFELVNRYGYSSVGVSSKVAPIAPGEDLKNFMKFSKEHLQHYAFQEAIHSLARTRSMDAPFLPVRPGEVIEDHTLGSDTPNIVTGYVVSTDFSLRVSGDSIAMSMGAQIDRSLRGTDADGYPALVRSLLSDLTFHTYAGQGVGEPGKHPAVDATFKPPPAPAVVRVDLPAYITTPIKAASVRQSIPAWLIAHVLHNETAFGRFWGTDEATAKKKGIAQITSGAVLGLQTLGYLNTNGTGFMGADRADIAKCIHACAAYLKQMQVEIETMPGGFPADGESYYSWVCRSYRWGSTAARALAASTGWKWPAAGEAYPDYARYWSPDGVEKGRKAWGYLG